MALVVSGNITISPNCKNFTFTETTGAYSAVGNPTGWGGVNPAIIGGAEATLFITAEDQATYTIPLPNTFPTADSSVSYIIPVTDMGVAEDALIPDGVYTFDLLIVNNSINYSQTWTQSFYCQVACCVRKLFKDLDLGCDSCAESNKATATDALLLLKGLEYTSEDANNTEFSKDLATLKKICLNQNCKNCK